MPVATTTTATTETHEDNGLCQDDIGSPRFCSGGRPLPRNRPELEHSLGRAARWSAAVRPSPLLYLLLATAIASCQATSRNGGSSSNYLSTNNNNHVRDYGESASRGGVVASSTLCPPKCKCLPNKQILCQEAGLDSLPTKYIPKDARQIQMMSNSISLIPTDAFKHFRHLKKLLLDNNQITVVAPNAFRGLQHMEELSLQNNPLTVLASYSFSGLQHIQFLNLGYNRIQSIEANAFADSRDIEHISLDANPLVIIKTKAFNDVRDVGVIYMPLRVDTIQADAFHGLENVTELAFDQMKSDAIGQFAFRGLNKVDRIIISNSAVRVFDSGAFTGLKDANTILLEGNIIQTIKAATFAGTRNVRSVKLVNNRISNLVPGSLDGLSPEVRQLRGNFIPCDCRLAWIQAVLRMSHATNTTFCSEPSELHNTTVAHALEVQRAQEQLSFNQVHTSCRPEDFEPKKGYSEQQKVNTATTAAARCRLTASSSMLFALLLASQTLAL